MTSISPKLYNFIVDQVGDKMTANEAQKAGVKNEFKEALEETDSFELEIEDFSSDLISKFSIKFEEEQAKKAETKDKEKEKEEQTEVKNKDGAGV